MDIIWSHNQESIMISYSFMVSIKYGNHKKSPLFTLSRVRQGLFQQFIACDACDACDDRTQPPAHFQTIFKFRTFFPKFSNILSFFALFRKNHTHALTFQNRPCQSAQFTMLESLKRFMDCLFQVSLLHVQFFSIISFIKGFTSYVLRLLLEASQQTSKK